MFEEKHFVLFFDFRDIFQEKMEVLKDNIISFKL